MLCAQQARIRVRERIHRDVDLSTLCTVLPAIQTS